jgi:Na+/H+ antiporter NhaD/arsenite permease-like protein
MRTVELARGRVWLLPWVTCALSAVICGIGALPAAALVITLPVAIRMAEQENIRPALMGIVTIQGACMGGFSPISPWGSLVAAQAARGGLPFSSSHFMITLILLNLATALVAFFAYGGARLIRRDASSTLLAEAVERSRGWQLTTYQWASLAALCVFVVLVLMRFDVGLSAFAVGIVLHIAFRNECQKAIAALPWGIVIMIAGLIIYVSLLEHLGCCTCSATG